MERETIKEFCKDAISNGYTGYGCNGWDWIRANIQRLDFIFETENYKKQGGMKYKCMPLILEHYPEATTEDETLLGAAWYLNNERESEKAKKEYTAKMIGEGYEPLTAAVIERAITLNKKIELNASHANDWQTVKVNKILKPKCFGTDYRLMELRAKTRGYRLSQFENAFCKLI